MKYCSFCATELILKVPKGDTFERSICPGCGAIHYESPSVVVTVCLHDEERLLWVRRGIEPSKGLWAFPGGFLEKGETIERAAIRELYEETGIKISESELVLIGLGSVTVMNQLYVSFRCECPRPYVAKSTNETLEAAWFTEEEAPWSEIAFPQAEGQIRKAYAWLKGGQFGLWVGDTTTEGVEYFLDKKT